MFGNWFKRSRRQALLQKPLDPQLLAAIEANVEHYRLLPMGLQKRLIESARIIAAERDWVGCRGLEVTDEMKLIVAAQASLLLLGTDDYYFERVPSFLLYPLAYRRPMQNREGGIVDDSAALLGEAHPHGSIVLSWKAALGGGQNAGDGENLVLHELSHHIDGLNGAMDGSPPMKTAADARVFDEAFAAEFAVHQDAVRHGEHTLIDPYGATNRAEFFAVSTELFYERPAAMRERHPRLYHAFTLVYSIDPSTWMSSKEKERAANELHQQHLQKHQECDCGHHHDNQATHEQRREMIAQLPKLRSADQYFTRAVEWMEAGEWDAAEADFTAALALEPEDQETLVYRSRARREQGLWELALADAERAIELAPKDIEAIAARGVCRIAMGGELTAGLADVKRAISGRMDDDELWFFRGLAEASLGDTATAVKSFTKIIERSPHDADAIAHRGYCYEVLGQTQLADVDFAAARLLGVEVEIEDRKAAE